MLKVGLPQIYGQFLKAIHPQGRARSTAAHIIQEYIRVNLDVLMVLAIENDPRWNALPRRALSLDWSEGFPRLPKVQLDENWQANEQRRVEQVIALRKTIEGNYHARKDQEQKEKLASEEHRLAAGLPSQMEFEQYLRRVAKLAPRLRGTHFTAYVKSVLGVDNAREATCKQWDAALASLEDMPSAYLAEAVKNFVPSIASTRKKS